MKYQGSKNRHSKEIVPIINSFRDPEQLYIEPFVGGANIIDKLLGPRWGNDIDPDLIALWKAVSVGWMPPKEGVSETAYHCLRQDEPHALKGYAAFALSYGGKKWGGWRRDKKGKRNYVDEARRNAEKQFPSLLGVVFTCMPYWQMTLPPNSVVYCDPPYSGTTVYKGEKFNHESFWSWVREQSKTCVVLVSEYKAPEDFNCLWEKEVASSLTQDTGGKVAVERLWIKTHA